MQILDDKQSRLLDTVRGYESCAVAFSGGVDSAVVCQAAALALGDRAVAITGSSNSLAAGELESAREVARQIGIRHEVIETAEFQQADYTRNAADRCFHCKTELYGQMRRVPSGWACARWPTERNLDDLGDYRPGLKAAADFDVQESVGGLWFHEGGCASAGAALGTARLEQTGGTLSVKSRGLRPTSHSRAIGDDRRGRAILAQSWFCHGVACVTTQEMWRVLEVPLADVPRLAAEPLRSELVDRLKTIGFRFIALDLEGFRSGNLNQLVSLEGFVEKPPGN